jgi:hypothetical protein
MSKEYWTFLILFTLTITMGHALAKPTMGTEGILACLVYLAIAHYMRRWIFGDQLIYLTPASLENKQPSVFIFGKRNETQTQRKKLKELVSKLISGEKKFYFILAACTILYLHIQFVVSFHVPVFFPLVIAVSILPVARLGQFIVPLMLSVLQLLIHNPAQSSHVGVFVYIAFVFTCLAMLYLTESEVRSRQFFKQATTTTLLNYALGLAVGFAGLLIILNKVIPEKTISFDITPFKFDIGQRKSISDLAKQMEQIEQLQKQGKLDFSKVDKKELQKNVENLEQMAKQNSPLQKDFQSLEQKLEKNMGKSADKNTIESILNSGKAGELKKQAESLEQKIAKQSGQGQSAPGNSGGDGMQNTGEKTGQRNGQNGQNNNQAQQGNNKSGANRSPASQNKPAAEPESKPEELPLDDWEKWKDYFLTFLKIASVCTFVFLLYKLIFKREAKSRDYSKALMNAKAREELLRRFRALEAERLSPRDEIIKKYHIFLEIMATYNVPKEIWVPPTEFSLQLKVRFQMFFKEIHGLTEIFSNTYYGSHNVNADVLNAYRSHFVRIFNLTA